MVLQVLGRLFMGLADDPFRALDAELARHALGGTAQAIVVDVHAEATSEKLALGHHLDGRVSLVVGTHTHVPTADARILAGGTGYITDLGMTGDYDSVIGMDKAGSLQKWRSDLPGPRLAPAMGEAMLCGVFVETDDRTGLARRIEPVRVGHGLRRRCRGSAERRRRMHARVEQALDRAARAARSRRRWRPGTAPALVSVGPDGRARSPTASASRPAAS